MVEESADQIDSGGALSDPAVDWVDELVSWSNGEFDECTRGGGGYKTFRATIEELGVAT